ncbi:hypothetical protein ACFE04_014732 [Oxalis oulophora]
MKNSTAVKKGAWDAEEDKLLRSCIEKYGEGKWHQVPLRAGLNRCRKSCRLRWLNYLKPDINREEFKDDEVDLIIRLHKLLGNRWTLIAGKLSGRTANDVKNYWNSHLCKKVSSPLVSSSYLTKQVKGKINDELIVKTKAIRPIPLKFKRNLLVSPTTCEYPEFLSNVTNDQIHAPCNYSFVSQTQKEEDEIMWWENLLSDDHLIDESINFSIFGGL